MKYKIRSAWGVATKEPFTSVFQNNKCEWLSEELENVNAFELNAFEFRKEWENKIQRAIDLLANLIEDHGDYPEDDLTKVIDQLNEFKYDPPYDNLNSNVGNSTWLIGFKEDANGKLKPDSEAEYSAIVGEVYTQVIRSKWGVKGRQCSPCYPCQVDPDSDGDWIGFSLPPEVIGEGNEAVRKKIFKLE